MGRGNSNRRSRRQQRARASEIRIKIKSRIRKLGQNEGLAAEAKGGDDEFPELKAIHVWVWIVEEIEGGMILQDAFVVLRAGDNAERNGGDVFCKDSYAGINPRRLGEGKVQLGGAADGVLAAGKPGASPRGTGALNKGSGEAMPKSAEPGVKIHRVVGG